MSRPPILFVTYSTPGEYRDNARRMIASAEAFGLTVEHYEEKPFSRWREALYHKVKVIRRAMRDNPDSNICWIDADAEVQDHPTLLFRMKPEYSVAAFVDHVAVRNDVGQIRGGQALWGGTLWFRRGEDSLRLLDLWEAENRPEKTPAGEIYYLDDNNLMHAVMKNGYGDRLYRLPPSYFYVPKFFRQRFPGAKPVIVQRCIGMNGDNAAKQREAAYRPWF